MDSRLERLLKVLEHIPEYYKELRDMNLPDHEIRRHIRTRAVCTLEKMVGVLARSSLMNRTGCRAQTKLLGAP